MKVYLCRTYGENGRNYNDVEVWGSYNGTNDFWGYGDSSITFTPLTVFEAKRIQQKTTSNYTTFWIEEIQE